ncbi:hypothetical protein Pmani_020153 [Petrolisthes manimaculis]|uniref:Uncharacterized protein n=1 Tax=Petrolisthes manimaculis TaxID=1843537 RepID=A0AAE1PJB6_9EUCA|nr:hypothetical protein Pmani_020153 [Petrolisthes manimaculis]
MLVVGSGHLGLCASPAVHLSRMRCVPVCVGWTVARGFFSTPWSLVFPPARPRGRQLQSTGGDMETRPCRCHSTPRITTSTSSTTSTTTTSTTTTSTTTNPTPWREEQPQQEEELTTSIRVPGCLPMSQYIMNGDDWWCTDGLCIPLIKRCDGHMNCYDQSDEQHCRCGPGKFQCGNNTSHTWSQGLQEPTRDSLSILVAKSILLPFPYHRPCLPLPLSPSLSPPSLITVPVSPFPYHRPCLPFPYHRPCLPLPLSPSLSPPSLITVPVSPFPYHRPCLPLPLSPSLSPPSLITVPVSPFILELHPL